MKIVTIETYYKFKLTNGTWLGLENRKTSCLWEDVLLAWAEMRQLVGAEKIEIYPTCDCGGEELPKSWLKKIKSANLTNCQLKNIELAKRNGIEVFWVNEENILFTEDFFELKFPLWLPSYMLKDGDKITMPTSWSNIERSYTGMAFLENDIVLKNKSSKTIEIWGKGTKHIYS